MFNQKEFLKELCEIRKRKGISNAEMARRLETSTSGLKSIETGNPGLAKLAKYLEIIGLDLNDIFVE